MLGLVLALSASAKANLIVNGGFETGDFTGWTYSPDPNYSQSYSGVAQFDAYAGQDAAYFGDTDEYDETISQSFATTPGQNYFVSYELAGDEVGGSDYFSAAWNGSTVASTVISNIQVSFPYTLVSFIETATGPTSSLTLGGYSYYGFFRVDNVSVVAVPEPKSIALGLLILPVAGLWIWKRRQANAV